MNKLELIERISQLTQAPKSQTDLIVSAFCQIVSETVASGKEVKLVGFGTFDTLLRQERIGRNPQTGSTMTIPASRVPRFRPGKEFKNQLTQNQN